MKPLSAKELIKNHNRKIAEEQLREYHLTHNYYNGKAFVTPYERKECELDREDMIAKKDQAYLDELLYPQPTLGDTFASSLSALILTPAKVTKQGDGIIKASEDLMQRITNWYDRYLADGLSELLEEQSHVLSSENIEIIKEAYPDQIVVVKNICILSAFWIRSPLTWDRTKGDLLEHLFMRYASPAFLKKYWLETITQENIQYLFVALAYTQGASLNLLAKHFSWRVPSQKLWHLLPQCEASFTFNEAILYTEFFRLGGSEAHFEQLLENESYCIDLLTNPNEDTVVFWYSMINWLQLNGSDLFGVQPSRILVWARHQFTEFRAENKVFSMNGRSLAKVLDNAVEYHAQGVMRRMEAARLAEARRLAEIERMEHAEEQERLAQLELKKYADSDFVWKNHGWDWEISTKKATKWKFTELTSSEELIEEGEAMAHCVASYDYDCYTQESAIVSLRLNNRRCATIEVEPSSGRLVQVSAFANGDISRNKMCIIEQWLAKVVN